MKVTSADEARALFVDRVPADSILRHVWMSGPYYAFLEIDVNGTRKLHYVGPRGGVSTAFHITAEQWKLIQ